MTKKDIEQAKTHLPSTQVQARGFESDYDKTDIIIPRVNLVQKTSPILDENIDGIKFGSIVNSLTKEILSETFIPIFMFKNWIRFNPRNTSDPAYDPMVSKGDIIWRSDDPKDPKVIAESKFGENGEKPFATTFMNFFSIFDGSPMPIIISFSKTSYKAGKNLLSLAKFSGGDMFSKKYKLTSKIIKGEEADYAILQVNPAGLASKEEYAIAEQYWTEFANKKLQIHEEEPVVEKSDDSTPDDMISEVPDEFLL